MARLHQALVLDLNTDVAEFCPHPEAADYLAVSTYQLQEETQTRIGRLHLYSLTSASGASPQADASARHEEPSNSDYALRLEAACDVPGIFDHKWRPAAGGNDDTGCRPPPEALQLGLALADGTFQLHQVTRDAPSGRHSLQSVASCAAVSEGMALHVDWRPLGGRAVDGDCGSAATSGEDSSSSTSALISGSGGHVSQVVVRPEGAEVAQEWLAHDLEAWMAVHDRHSPDVAYSGSDDSSFKGWDLRAGGDAPTFVNRKAHGAGVCAISCHLSRPHLLATGSYDERVRLWDMRNASRPLVVHELGTGGGNWRLKWCPHNPAFLLVAAMYNGFFVCKLNDVGSELEVAEEYKGHGSIAYGVDWWQGSVGQGGGALAEADSKEQSSKRGLVASCSFYDRLLHLWAPQTDTEAIR